MLFIITHLSDLRYLNKAAGVILFAQLNVGEWSFYLLPVIIPDFSFHQIINLNLVEKMINHSEK